MEIAINRYYGGFGVSKAVFDELGIKWHKYSDIGNEDFGIESDDYYAFRTNKKLIDAIKKIGLKEASEECALLGIVDIPDDVEWEIEDYMGMETVHEVHRSWK